MMSKITITLYDYIRGELVGQGGNEIYDYLNLNNPDDDWGMRWDDDEEAFLTKMAIYDEDVEKVINDRIFRGLKLEDEVNDKQFKRMFLMRYLNQQIGYQTIEEFSMRVIYLFMGHKTYLDYYNQHLEDMIQSKTVNESNNKGHTDDIASSTGNSTNTANSRNANVTLPQNDPFMDLASTRVDYADDTQAEARRETVDNVSKDISTSNTTDDGLTTNVTHSLDELEKVRNTMRELVNEYEAECFLLVW